jgi:predicted DCC family thiol-disulfide oxidoreductase YuxK
MATTTLLYDEDCGFCRWSADKILAWDRTGAIRALPLQSAEAEDLLANVDRATRMASWHLVTDESHRVRSGGEAVEPLLRLLPGGTPLALVAHALPATTNRAYRFVARHRIRLGSWLGLDACTVRTGHG